MKSLAENVITFCRCREKHFHAHLANITEEDILAGAIVTEGSYQNESQARLPVNIKPPLKNAKTDGFLEMPTIYNPK